MGLSRTLLASLVWGILGSIALAQDIVPPSSLKGQLLDLARRTNVAAVGSPELVGDTDVDLLSVLTALEISTAPFGTSTGSFTFTFDNRTGTFVRAAESFGPAFGKRSLTNGRGKLSVGFNWLHADYDTLGDLDLGNGDVQPVRNVRTVLGGPTPLPDASQLRTSIVSDTYVGFASFGLYDRFDVGIAVPWVRISLRADVALVKNGVDVTPGGNVLVLPEDSAQGIGDIALTAKYRVFERDAHGAAVEFELRLPSGDPDNLRGTGVTRTLVSAIWSRAGTVSPHASLGYEFWSAGVPLSQANAVSARNQISYTAGLEVVAHPRATVIFDLVGRRQLGGGTLAYGTEPLGPFVADYLRALPEAVDVVSFAPGVKWNVGGNVLMSAHVLASVANAGLRARIVPTVGFEVAF